MPTPRRQSSPGAKRQAAGQTRGTHLVRSTTRPNPPKTRVLLVRPPARSVRASEGPDPMPTRLAIGTLTTLGIIAAVWLIGQLGFQLGFARLMHVPDLSVRPAGALATGTLMMLSMPRMIFEAGLDRPEWVMVCFALIAIPAAGLSAARPRVPGGPRTPTVVLVFAVAGVATAALFAATLVWWSASTARASLLRPLPPQPDAALEWAQGLQIVAGFDVLAVAAAALWVVLVWRLPVPGWLRALGVSVSLFGLAVGVVGMASSNAAASLVHTERAVCVGVDHDDLYGQLLLGTTPHRHAMLHVEGRMVLVELVRPGEPLTVIGTESVVEYLQEQAQRTEAPR